MLYGVCAAAEIRYFCQSEAFNHVSTTVMEHKYNPVVADVPAFQQADEHVADVLPSVGARHGLGI